MNRYRQLSAPRLLAVALVAGSVAGPLAAGSRIVTLLPSQDVYVDPSNPGTVFSGDPLEVSSTTDNAPQKLALLLFDLSTIPSGSTIEQAQLVAASPQPGLVPQVVRATVLDNTTWPAALDWTQASSLGLTTVGSAPCTSAAPPCLAGQWLMPGSPDAVIVFTNADNPALVEKVEPGGKLTLQLSSNSAQGLAVSYSSSTTAATNETYSYAPRLLVTYTPPAGLLARDWAQWQGDGQRTGRTEWKYAQSPVSDAVAGQTFSTNPQPSAPVIYGGQIYYFATDQGGNKLYRMAPDGTVTALAASLPTGTVSTALGPPGYLYAATSGELALVNLDGGGTVAAKASLTSFTGRLTAGPAGGVYLTEVPAVNSYRVTAFALLGGSPPSLVRSWELPLTSAPGNTVTLAADASLVYVTAGSSLYAVCNATVSPPAGCSESCSAIGKAFWTATVPSTHQIPVAADDGASTVYLASGDDLYAYQCTSSPLQNTPIQTSAAFAQPVLNGDNVLLALQSKSFYALYTYRGSVYQASSSCVQSGTGCDTATAVSQSDLDAGASTVPVLDGNDHVYYVDGSGRASAFAYRTPSGQPELATVFAGQSVTAPASGTTLGPSGTAYYATANGIVALEPKVACDVTVSTWTDGTAYRAAGTLTPSSAAMPAASSIILQSNGSIAYPTPTGASFTVPTGTQVFHTSGCCTDPPPSCP